jgi:hypothetical protein
MNPDPSPPPGGKPLAPRHRPNLDDLNRDTTEQDLWDLDDSDNQPASEIVPQRPTLPPPPAPPSYRRPPQPAAPEPSAASTQEPDPTPDPPDTPTDPPEKTVILPRIPSGPSLRGGQSGIQLGLRGRRPEQTPAQAPHGKHSSTEEEFDALDDWEQFPALSQTLPNPGQAPATPSPAVVTSEPRPIPAAAPSSTIEESPDDADPSEPEAPSPIPPAEAEPSASQPAPPETSTAAPSGLTDEFSPPPANPSTPPLSLRPKLRLSLAERIGMLALVLLLLVGAGAFLILTLQRLPKEDNTRFNIPFPVQGKLVAIQSATTYWRAPLSSGGQVDTFRRGTALLPVIELEGSANDALIRVFFYDGEGQPVGDAVTRPVRGNTKITLAATAGFDDPGLHAAYRTGLSPLWNIILYEGPPGATSASEFKKILEIPIASELR